MTTPVTAVFDIGKTNKKFFVFDEDYSIVQKQQTTLDQSTDEDGDPCEDLKLLENWIYQTLQEACLNDNFQIKALNFSGYGASLVHVDKQGKPATPLYNYTKSYPEELLSNFYERYGGRKEFVLQTASPPLGMLNSGLQLYWLKHVKPQKFKEIDQTLHFPQYLSYLITGKYSAELTSIGCHTGLWNYEKQDYHRWVGQEDLLRLLPQIEPVSTTFDTRYQECDFNAGLGIHDSNAALAPYLLALDEPFMLISTGTWSITLNSFNEEPLTYEELQKDCLCFLDINGNQVKASRFFLGNEYMHQLEKLAKHFGIDDSEEEVGLDPVLLKRLINNPDSSARLKLETAHHSGPYPQDKPGEWQVDKFTSFKEAYHQFMLDLVAIEAESIKLAQGLKGTDKLIITGGFCQNDFFVTLLASFFPEKSIYTASLPHASALGAAMVVNRVGKGEDEHIDWKEILGLELHPPLKGIEIERYSWKPVSM